MHGIPLARLSVPFKDLFGQEISGGALAVWINASSISPRPRVGEDLALAHLDLPASAPPPTSLAFH